MTHWVLEQITSEHVRTAIAVVNAGLTAVRLHFDLRRARARREHDGR